MTAFLMDIRYALRWLIKRPAYSFVFILSLSIGMSLNTIIYSTYDAFFTKRLSAEVKNQSDLVWLLNRDNNSHNLQDGILYRDYLEYSENTAVFSDIIVSTPFGRRLLIWSEDVAAEAALRHVSGNYFTALGIKPFIGRGFNLNDEREERDYVLITYKFWKVRFGGEPSAVGKTLYIDNIPHTIIGVLPKGFDGVERRSKADAYTMLGKLMKTDSLNASGGMVYSTKEMKLLALARFDKGVSLSRARAEMDIRSRQTAIAYPDTNKDIDIYIAPVSEGHPRMYPPTMKVKGFLALIIVLVMLIPCVNVASLLLNRAVERSHEFALRSALGAARMRIVRQLLTELLILNILGGGFAILVFRWLVHVISSGWVVSDIPTDADWKVIGYAIGFCIVISMLFGLLPVLHVIRANLASNLKSQGMAKGHGARMVLVCVELAISLAVMILLAPAIFQRDKLPSELQERRILIADFDPALHSYTDMKADQVKSEILAGVKSIPGVRNASFSTGVPYVSVLEGCSFFTDSGSSTVINCAGVGHGWFDTLNIPIIRGRDIWSYDYRYNEKGAQEIIINKSMAEKYWPNEDVLGKQIAISTSAISFAISTLRPPYSTIVGVVADSDLDGAGSAEKPMVFSPWNNPKSAVTFIAHFMSNENEVKSLIRQKIMEIDPQLARMANVRSLEQHYNDHNRAAKILTNIIFWLGMVVFIVAITGIYSTISYVVNRRMREVGIRIMVGATTGDIVKLLISTGVKIVIFGVAVGAFLAWIATAWIIAKTSVPQAYVPGILEYVCVSVIISVIMITACCFPIMKAIRSEPVNLVK